MISSTDMTAAKDMKSSSMRVLLYNFSWSAFQNLSGYGMVGGSYQFVDNYCSPW